jgi:hypothetical protein
MGLGIKVLPTHFTVLAKARHVRNAVYPLRSNPHFGISVSHTPPGGAWHVGEYDNFEIALLLRGDMLSVFSEEGRHTETNIKSGVTCAALQDLYNEWDARYATTDRAIHIEVFDVVLHASEPAWGTRFWSLPGTPDLRYKLQYVKRIWGDKSRQTELALADVTPCPYYTLTRINDEGAYVKPEEEA